jgi:biopolymer transport protein ExbD
MQNPLSTDHDDVEASINITPFVDVVLVLLVIFMVTTDFMKPTAIEVELPRAAQGGDLVATTLNLMVRADGTLALDGEPVDMPQLDARLRAAVAAKERPQVVIAADKSVDYGRVITLIDLVKTHGIDDFALQIERG